MSLDTVLLLSAVMLLAALGAARLSAPSSLTAAGRYTAPPSNGRSACQGAAH